MGQTFESDTSKHEVERERERESARERARERGDRQIERETDGVGILVRNV